MDNPTKGILAAQAGARQPRPAEPEKRKATADEEKVDFEDAATIAARQRADHMKKMQDAAKGGLSAEGEVAKLNEALQGAAGGSEGDKLEKELQEMVKYSPEDLALAEQLLFTGRAEKPYRFSDKYSANMSTMSTLEVAIINEMLFEFTKKHEDKDGRLDVSQRQMDLHHQLLMLSFSFKGYNGDDFASNKSYSLDLIKNAIRKLAELEIGGEIDHYKKLKEEIKKAASQRMAELRAKFPATIVDVLSQKRYELERLMHDILNRGDVLPKS